MDVTQTGPLQEAVPSVPALAQTSDYASDTARARARLVHLSKPLKRSLSSPPVLTIPATSKHTKAKVTKAEDGVSSISQEIKVKPVRHEKCESYCRSHSENLFMSFLSPSDFFRLTGNNGWDSKLVYINRDPCLVKAFHELEPGTMVVNPCTSFTHRQELALSPCSEKLPTVSSATLRVHFAKDADRMESDFCIDSSAKALIAANLKGVPLTHGKVFSMETPVISVSPDGQPGLPEFLRVEVQVQPAGSEAICGPFLINDTTTIGVVDGIKGDFRYLKDVFEDRNIVTSISGSSDYNSDNFAHLNVGHFRPLAQKVERIENKMILCKIGDYHYFCRPKDSDEHKYSNVYTNQLLPSRHKSVTVTPCDPQILSDARSCKVELSWFTKRQTISLNEIEITEKVKQAMKQLPLEKGRKFLIPLQLAASSSPPLFVQGCVVEVGGAQDAAGLFRVHDKTELQLNSDDPVLLKGGEVAVHENEQILAELATGLSGMGSLIEQLFNEVILPMQLYRNSNRVTPPRGIMFTGPPGNGKSKLAANLVNVLRDRFNCAEIEIKHDFIGATAEGTNSKFSSIEEMTRRREDANPNQARFTLFFMDEFDSLIMGSRSDTTSDTKLAFKNTLQKMMSDGPHNMLFVATTNLEGNCFDEALMRPGRFDLVIPVENPDQEQREAILREALANTKYDIKDLDITALARQSGEQSAAGLISLVNDIVCEACKRGAEDSSSLTLKDVEQALTKPATIETQRKAALSQLYDKDREGCILANEREALDKTAGAIARVQGSMGRHSVIVVNAQESRSGTFCNALVQWTKNDPSVKDGRCEKRLFNRFSIIPSHGGGMTGRTIAALGCQAGNITLAVVDGVESLLKEKGGLGYQPEQVGKQWKRVKGSNSQSTALVLISRDKALGSNEIKQALDLSAPVDEAVTLNSDVEKQDYENILDKMTNVKPGAKEALLGKILSEGDIDIERFQHLINLYEVTDERGMISWDLKGIEENIRRNKMAALSMYS